MPSPRSRKPVPTVRVRVPSNEKGKKFSFMHVPFVTPIKPKVRANGREYLRITNSRVLEKGAFRTASAARRMQERLAKAFAQGKISKEQYLRARKRIEGKSERLHGLIHQQTIRLAERDPMLSMLFNKKTFFERLQEHIHENPGKPFTYVILDVDFFKRINDELGHAAGDVALRFFAGAVNKAAKRYNGIAGRFGGEELVVAIPAHGYMARGLVQSINKFMREGFAAEETVRSTLKGRLFTFSAGAHEMKKGEKIAALAEMADKKLYKAKHAGRDMLVYDVDTSHSRVTMVNSIRGKPREA